MKLGFFSKLQILLNSRKIFKNWYVYPKVYWQLTNDKIVVFETKTGLKIKIRVKSTDLMALTNVWMINEYDVDGFEINSSDIIIDVGAHIGLFSLLVSQFCKTGKIFSFEPIRENFDLLVSNLALNHIENVFPFNVGVSKKSGKLNLFLNNDQSAHSIFPKGSESITVEAISLQKIFDEKQISSCKLLKLDCEGAEYDIIDSLPVEYLDKIQNMAIEYHLADTKPELIKNLILKIKNAGFKIKTGPHYNDMGFLIARK
ncbi:FkbM family methyltransferase [Marine Group I thaumarchaeote]|uniref:FkbM family methyltransferase n=1 Tax=Marine Group I thaumarchaeote TaxID=2511932 RepID=A0A7K4NTF5_9ARCH|nr:FkbM family methyltransferase [Marine Group I thaumarchaeote]